LLGGELGLGKYGRVRLHGEAVERGGPELVELLVALDAAPGTGKTLVEVHPVDLIFRQGRDVFLLRLYQGSQDQDYSKKKDFQGSHAALFISRNEINMALCSTISLTVQWKGGLISCSVLSRSISFVAELCRYSHLTDNQLIMILLDVRR
jgi:hypothetical protein